MWQFPEFWGRWAIAPKADPETVTRGVGVRMHGVWGRKTPSGVQGKSHGNIFPDPSVKNPNVTGTLMFTGLEPNTNLTLCVLSYLQCLSPRAVFCAMITAATESLPRFE